MIRSNTVSCFDHLIDLNTYPHPSGKGEVTATVKAIYHNKAFVQTTADIPEGASFGVLLDQTSFYAESGGQENDTGKLIHDDATFEVVDVQVSNGYVLHVGYLTDGHLKVGQEVLSKYSEVRALSHNWLVGTDSSFSGSARSNTAKPYSNSHSQFRATRSFGRSYRPTWLSRCSREATL